MDWLESLLEKRKYYVSQKALLELKGLILSIGLEKVIKICESKDYPHDITVEEAFHWTYDIDKYDNIIVSKPKSGEIMLWALESYEPILEGLVTTIKQMYVYKQLFENYRAGNKVIEENLNRELQQQKEKAEKSYYNNIKECQKLKFELSKKDEEIEMLKQKVKDAEDKLCAYLEGKTLEQYRKQENMKVEVNNNSRFENIEID